MTNYNEIDNPLPDQVMRQMDADAEEQACKKECFERAKEICEEHSVFPELIEDFQEWAWSMCLDADSCLPSAEHSSWICKSVQWKFGRHNHD